MEKRVAGVLNLLQHQGLQLGDFQSEDQIGMLEVMEDFFTNQPSESDDSDEEGIDG